MGPLLEGTPIIFFVQTSILLLQSVHGPTNAFFLNQTPVGCKLLISILEFYSFLKILYNTLITFSMYCSHKHKKKEESICID